MLIRLEVYWVLALVACLFEGGCEVAAAGADEGGRTAVHAGYGGGQHVCHFLEGHWLGRVRREQGHGSGLLCALHHAGGAFGVGAVGGECGWRAFHDDEAGLGERAQEVRGGDPGRGFAGRLERFFTVVAERVGESGFQVFRSGLGEAFGEGGMM